MRAVRYDRMPADCAFVEVIAFNESKSKTVWNITEDELKNPATMNEIIQRVLDKGYTNFELCYKTESYEFFYIDEEESECK